MTQQTYQQPPVAPEGYKLKKKKPIFKRVWFWLLAIIALIVIISVATSGGGDTTSGSASTSTGAPSGNGDASPAPAADDPLSDDGWIASDVQVEDTQFGSEVTARVTNTEDSSRTGVFTLTVFSNGQRIGQVMGSANEVEAGQAATVTFMGTDELPGDSAAFTYELQSDI